MSLSKVHSTTYRVSTTLASSSGFIRPVQARLASLPVFPSQVALVGGISDRFRLAQPLVINFEDAGNGDIIASDEIFYMYGVGATRREALEDYVSSLSEYYELLESYDDDPSIALFHYLHSYLQPISR